MGKGCVVFAMQEPPYRDKEWLETQYVEKDRSITDIADELGVDHTTISKWRRKLDIPKPNKRVELECPVCGEIFTRCESKVERVKYTNVCSRECIYEGRSKGIIERDVQDGYDVEPTQYTKECVFCGSEFTVEKTKKDQRHCSRKCFNKNHAERMAGEGNPQYKDGSSQNKRCYRGPHWERERQLVYERDDYTCQRCGVKCISRRDYNGENGDQIIQAHHIGGYDTPQDNLLDDLVTLCAKCHGEVEQGEPLNVS